MQMTLNRKVRNSALTTLLSEILDDFPEGIFIGEIVKTAYTRGFQDNGSLARTAVIQSALRLMENRGEVVSIREEETASPRYFGLSRFE